MKKNIFPILFLAAIAIFMVIPSQKKIQAAPGASSSTTPSPTVSPAPAGFFLDWTSSSFVPPWYRGKALAASDSTIRVVAAPTRPQSPDPAKQYFSWRVNDKPIGADKELGKSVLEFKATGQPGQNFKINCRIFDAKQNLLAEKTISIALARPQVLFYDSLTLGGNALKNAISTKTDQKLHLAAVPFFFPSNSPDDLDYNWRFDGQKLESPNQQGLDRLTLSVPGGKIIESLIKQLTLSVTAKKDRLQQATTNLEITIRP